LTRDVFIKNEPSDVISHLNTNGALLDERNAKKVISAGVDSINISLDGACAETHDKIRGVKGAFDRAVEAVGLIRAERKKADASLRIKTVAVLQEDNIGEAREMVRLAGDLGVECIEFIPRQSFADVDGGRSGESPAFLARVAELTAYLTGPEKKEVKIENSPAHLRLFQRSFRGESSPLRCYAGYNSLAVDCYGEVYPCVPWYNWGRSAGSVRDKGLAAFWRSDEYDEVRREVRDCRRCYLNCQGELNILFAVGSRGMRR